MADRATLSTSLSVFRFNFKYLASFDCFHINFEIVLFMVFKHLAWISTDTMLKVCGARQAVVAKKNVREPGIEVRG